MPVRPDCPKSWWRWAWLAQIVNLCLRANTNEGKSLPGWPHNERIWPKRYLPNRASGFLKIRVYRHGQNCGIWNLGLVQHVMQSVCGKTKTALHWRAVLGGRLAYLGINNRAVRIKGWCESNTILMLELCLRICWNCVRDRKVDSASVNPGWRKLPPAGTRERRASPRRRSR